MKILLIILFLLPFFTFSAAQVAKAEESVVETDALVGEEKVATESTTILNENVNYELPYPGMLPDNPFYFLKAIRDGIVKFLINDELKRSKFSLLNAEKRMFAGKLLVDKGKEALAIETISKSNNYLHEAVVAIDKYASTHPKSTDVKPFILQMNTAIAKHNQIMEDIEKQIDNKNKKTFDVELKRLNLIKKNVDNLLLQY